MKGNADILKGCEGDTNVSHDVLSAVCVVLILKDPGS